MTVSVKGGIKKIRAAQIIPETTYMWKVDKVGQVVAGDDKKTAGARYLQATPIIDGGFDQEEMEEIELEDESLIGRRGNNIFLGSPDTGLWGGLLQLLDAAQQEDIPEGEEDEDGEPLVSNIVGIRFPGHSKCNRNGYMGRVENNVIPIIDPEYIDARSTSEAVEEEEEEEEAPRRRRKAIKKKKATKRTRSR